MDNFLTIKEAVNRYIAGCENKVSASTRKLFARAFFAGMVIALGASASSVAAHSISNVGLARLATAAVFPVGLMMIIVLGAELATGDCLVVMATAAGKHKISKLIRTLVIVYISNFIGACLTAVAVEMSGQFDFSNGLLGAYTIKLAVAKTTMPFTKALISGVLCNILVCSAILMSVCAKDVVGKLITVFFTLMLFIVSGFEHCIANMYYIAAGMIAATNPVYVESAMENYGYTAEQIMALDWQSFLVGNLLPVTLGNLIGGMLVVAIPFYLVEGREK